MKKVKLSGAKDEEDSQQKGALDAWLKRNKKEVGTVKDGFGIAEDSSDFAICYEHDVTAIQFYHEIVDFVMLIKAGENTVSSDPKEVLEALVKFGKGTFPTVCIAYRLLFIIAFSIASCERSFSKTNLIKSFLRLSMSQERLTNLAIIDIKK